VQTWEAAVTKQQTVVVALALAGAVLVGLLIKTMDDAVTRIAAQTGDTAAPTGPLSVETFRRIAAAQSRPGSRWPFMRVKTARSTTPVWSGGIR
jgi:hypothetical protein